MKIFEPVLILDKLKCLNNIERMIKKAKDYNVVLRPHFKTHQSKQIGNWFRDYSINSITVSSFKMAKYFAEDGWNNITVAFPVNIREIDLLNELSNKIVVNILITTSEIISFLENKLKNPVGVFIKIDTGYHRSGITYNFFEKIDDLFYKIKNCRKLNFKGFLTHAGNTYNAGTLKEVDFIHTCSINKLKKIKDRYSSISPEIILSIGDTPSCVTSENFDGIDEIKPGNFVFFDIMQNFSGICSENDIAIAVACPIVDIRSERNEIVIYGGAIHFSKEYILFNKIEKCYGKVVVFNKKNWTNSLDNTYLCKLSQEHGIIKTSEQIIKKFNIGDVVGILPVHSCLTANLMKGYRTFDDQYIDHMNNFILQQ